jgi:protein-S-isoprenylcysteine O-methyltransferase Ste14
MDAARAGVSVWLRAALFIVLVPGSVAGWLPRYVAAGDSPPADARPAVHWLGAVFAAVGWAVLLWCARDFAQRGRGTPAPYDPPRALVTSNLYGIVRNPMYVGVVTAILGQALWYWSLRALAFGAIIALGFHLRVLVYEEPRLTELFGEHYTNYRARVPRWLPRLTRKPAR